MDGIMTISAIRQASREQPGRSRRIVLLAVLLLLGGGYGIWRSHGDEAAKAAASAAAAQPPPKVPVTAATVRKADFPLYLYGLGTVTPLNSVSISSRVAGVVDKVPVEQGQMVKQGDLLAEIDPRPYQAALDQAKAKEAEDEATLKNAQVVLKRLSTLLQKTFETQQDVDNQQAVVTTTAATIEGDKAAIEAAQLNLDYTKITSPLAGKTSFRTIDPGNIVQADQSAGLFTVVQLEPIYVSFTQPQDEVSTINKAFAAGPVSIDVLSSDMKTVLASGKLDAVQNQVDQASGTISLKAAFPNKDQALWPGLSVNTRLRVGMIAGATLVPDEAVQHGPDGLFTYIVGDDGKAHRQTIKTGPSDGGNTVVTDGLSPGQRVVDTGQYRLVDGTSVDAQPASAGAAQQPKGAS
ncbi:efflux RND transporter periplasmic adaptor subunit [Mesorhizobium sp. VK25A]|uniref:Efflux RND transporter periplasmic adaptor subunit n=1 Tax=Mesorhizobium vachelliae TaxID=3072309 RepID=A0ABU5ABI7_9HYPH|nr:MULTISPECIES: efflux RND transporter periplasmic adaptor subunit [unclassified Mesorhizobium]MDX8535050.1 efflux RND transporter periplasmic adaptor subunit [Mesorhizobium sp. VK25D]MDX8547694.1 efflux RND transporter periplasmic adaptor subunit [Mesorhizobium sp. VK25A]